jgi:hypothetical protein
MTKIHELLQKIGERGGFYIEYYLDYRERQLEDGTILKVVDSDDPEMTLGEILWEWECDLSHHDSFYEHLVEEVQNEIEDAEKDDIIEAAHEVGFWVCVDHNEFLEHNHVRTVVALKDIDIWHMNQWEFTKTGRLKYMESDQDPHWGCFQPGIIKLLRSLGTSFYQFKRWYDARETSNEDYLHNPDKYRENFHFSIYEEYLNLCYDYGCLVFLCYPIIKEYIELTKAKEIVIEPGTTCGFHNPGPGSGSILGIEIDKPLVFTEDEVQIFPDDNWSYGVQTVHDLHMSAWEGNIKPI